MDEAFDRFDQADTDDNEVLTIEEVRAAYQK
jgi:hypothetical protein